MAKKVVKKVPVEVYSRVVGYFRPVQHWNEGKQQEFKERRYFDKSVNRQKKDEQLVSA